MLGDMAKYDWVFTTCVNLPQLEIYHNVVNGITVLLLVSIGNSTDSKKLCDEQKNQNFIVLLCVRSTPGFKMIRI